jgi:hypothetical protein
LNGNTTIISNLNVSSNANIQNNLIVTGNTILQNNVTVLANLNISGSTIIQGLTNLSNLNVLGSTNLISSLFVSSYTTLNSSLVVKSTNLPILSSNINNITWSGSYNASYVQFGQLGNIFTQKITIATGGYVYNQYASQLNQPYLLTVYIKFNNINVLNNIRGPLLSENIQTLDPEQLVKTWLPLSIQGWGEVQKMFWSQMGMKAPGTSGGKE